MRFLPGASSLACSLLTQFAHAVLQYIFEGKMSLGIVLIPIFQMHESRRAVYGFGALSPRRVSVSVVDV